MPNKSIVSIIIIIIIMSSCYFYFKGDQGLPGEQGATGETGIGEPGSKVSYYMR